MQQHQGRCDRTIRGRQPDKYGSISKARKALRKGYILRISRGEDGTFDRSKCIRARVNDRIYPMDVLAEQSRLGNTFYPRDEEPPFSLPVIYEDDFFAIVNKPAGVNVNSHRKSGIGHMCVRAASPYVLTPPAFGTRGVIRRRPAVSIGIAAIAYRIDRHIGIGLGRSHRLAVASTCSLRGASRFLLFLVSPK